LIVSETGGLAETLDRTENIPLKVRFLSVFPKKSAGWLANLPVGFCIYVNEISFMWKKNENKQTKKELFL